MSSFSKHVGVQRLAIALSVVGVIAGSVWEYENSPIMLNWWAYRWVRTQQAARPGSRLVRQKDGSVILVRTVPAVHRAATPPEPESDLGEGWTSPPVGGSRAVDVPAHDEEIGEAGVFHVSGAGDDLVALMAVLLAGLAPFLLVHATAWVVHGFRKP